MNDNFAAQLKEKANIVTIIEQYVPLKHVGNNYKACCPFHKEKTPSFIVNEQKQSYKCFGCGKSGDVYTFIQEIENVDFTEALEILASKLGISVPAKRNDFHKDNTPKKLKEIHLIAGRYYYKNLLRNKIAIEYLQQRGVRAEMIKAFGIGYADNTNNLLNELKDFSTDLLLKSGIISERNGRKTLTFQDRIMFPILNTRNEIIAFGGRQLGKWGPKYLNSPETLIYSKKDNLYALNIARKHISDGNIFLVEGYMDVVSMHQHGYKNAVATLGTALTSNQAKELAKIANNVFLLYDSDQAGINAAKKALDILQSEKIDARVIDLKNAKDPDEFFRKNDEKAFSERINNSLDYLMFNLLEIQKKLPVETPFGKDSFMQESVAFIKAYREKSFYRQIYIEGAIRYLSQTTGYSIKSIGTDIFGKYFSPKYFFQTENEKIDSFDEFDIDEEIDRKERIILHALSTKRVHFHEIVIEDFVHAKNRRDYYLIKRGDNIFENESEEFPLLSENEYAILIKSIKSTKLKRKIEFMEALQEKLLRDEITPENSKIALVIGQKIMELKKIGQQINKE